jgi:Sulfotransferase family
MGARLEVVEVVQAGPPGSGERLVLESSIDRPSVERDAGVVREDWSLDVRGWAVGASAPVEHVEFSAGGVILRRVPCDVARPALAAERPDLTGAGSSGFYATLSALDLPRPFEVGLDAVLADGRRAPIGVIRGTRAQLTTSFAPGLQPLMVSGPGRSGSTIFMQMLAGHEQIAVHPPFDEEPRVATYWVDVLRALARPESWMRQISPAGPLGEDWWLGRRDPVPRRLRSKSLQGWLAGHAVEDVATFAQSRIEAVYTRIAAEEGKSGTTYFAEKVRNDIVSDLLWELYPDAREVVLVRDPRDVLTSILAAKGKRAAQPLPADPARWVGEEFTGRILAVLDSWHRRRDRTHLVRYEDLMMRPRDTLAGVAGYLGLDAGPDSVDPMIEGAGRRLPGMDEHRTSADSTSSIGRWRRDLEPDLAKACERAVLPALDAWGYTPEHTSHQAETSTG